MLNEFGAHQAQAVQAAVGTRGRRARQDIAIKISGMEELTNVINLKLLEYERQSGDAITGRFKIAVVTRYAPIDHHDLVTAASSDAGQDHARFRTKTLNALQSGQNFSGTGVRSDVHGDPMDVGAIDGKGKWMR
eukprot:1948542-Heterocapsa_arctica.AAC.1